MAVEQSNKRVALYLQDKHPIRDGMEYARYAESRGFEAVWQAESRLVRDAIVPMAAFAAVTERIKIGSGVINNWTRNIGLLAATFLTLDDLAPDRIICGVGSDEDRPTDPLGCWSEEIQSADSTAAPREPSEGSIARRARLAKTVGSTLGSPPTW